MATQQQTFSNPTLLSTELPSIEKLAQQPIETVYASTNRIINLSITLFFVMIVLVIKYQSLIEISAGTEGIVIKIFLAVAVLSLLFTFYKALADVRKFYALREQDISFTSGVIFKKTVSQPILRIQHVELKRGPIDRKIGLANLQVFSAGGAMHTFEIPGLKLDDAESIRQFILSHKDANHHG
jgi:membrane protein YdbS with pleckstrin-like domain